MALNARIAIAALSLSAAGFMGIVAREHYSGVAYADPTYGWKVPTIGLGVTGPDVKRGDVTDPVKAIRQSIAFIAKDEVKLRACLGDATSLKQSEWDRWVSFSYNIGSSGFCKSGVAKSLRAGNYEQACHRILDWNKSNGQRCDDPANRTCRGLWSDRLDMHKACLGDAAQ